MLLFYTLVLLMTIERKLGLIFKMNEETWKRHSNPWSVITRNTVTPLLVLAFWSRVWIGWYSLIPIVLSLVWMYVNPRVFSPPKSTDNWASKGVFGERIWLNRDKIPIPEYHKKLPNILSMVSGIGFLFVIWGIYTLEIWPLLFGGAIQYAGKLWFVDRMVWLYEDMKHLPEYDRFGH